MIPMVAQQEIEGLFHYNIIKLNSNALTLSNYGNSALVLMFIDGCISEKNITILHAFFIDLLYFCFKSKIIFTIAHCIVKDTIP